MSNVQKKMANKAARLKDFALKKADSDLMLLCARYYGYLNRFNYLGLYRDDDFEIELVDRFKHFFVHDPNINVSDNVLHVISEPYASGGHTRLLERLVSFDTGACDVVVTRPYSPDSKKLRLDESVRVLSQPEGYNVRELISVFSSYKKVLLHIHPDDIVAAVALGVVRHFLNVDVIFVNHADHVFSYGFFSSDIVAEVSTFGFALSRARRGCVSSYLGIPLPVDEFPECKATKGATLNIFSSGSPGKFVPTKSFSFLTLTAKILREVPDSRITIIGPSYRKNYWWTLKLLHPFRLSLYKVLPYQQYIKFIETADVYIDSIPMSGGTAVSEVRSKGIPVTGVKTGALGYSVFDQIKCSSYHEMVDELKSFKFSPEKNPILQKNNSPETLHSVRAVHSMDAVKHRYHDIVYKKTIFDPMILNQNQDLHYYERNWSESSRVNIVPNEFLALFKCRKVPFDIMLSVFFMAPFRQKISILKSLLKDSFRSLVNQSER